MWLGDFGEISIKPLPLLQLPHSQPPGRWCTNLFCCESRCGVRKVSRGDGWVFEYPKEMKQHKNFNQFVQLQMLWKVFLLAPLFLSTLLSRLMQPPSCKARFYCRKDNRGGKCLVLNAPLLQDGHFKCWTSFYFCCYQVKVALVWAQPGWDQQSHLCTYISGFSLIILE